MSPIPPREDLKNARSWSLRTIVVVALLILLGLYVYRTYFMQGSDPDRPPIIISSGSVTVTSGGDWSDEGGKGYKQDVQGKSVKTFNAATGVGIGGSACMVEGTTIVVTYGNNEVTFTRKRKGLLSKYGAFAQFPANANMSHPAAGQLQVTTTDALVSFRNENGNSCNVQAGTLTIGQLH
ncbi:MAG: hypothetical protein ABIP90_12525 [Vicinamibacterales bacterium]